MNEAQYEGSLDKQRSDDARLTVRVELHCLMGVMGGSLQYVPKARNILSYVAKVQR